MPRRLPYLRVANVEAGRINLDELLSIGVTEEEAVKLCLQLDDLLFVEGNGAKSQIGRVAVWKGQVDHCVHQNHLIRARCHQAASSFVAQYYSTPYGRTEIEGKAFTSSGLYSLSVEKIKDLAILVPGEKEQHVIGLLLEGLDNLITLHQRKRPRYRRFMTCLGTA